MGADYDKCFSPAQVRGLTLRNRLIKAATFEGMTPGGVPTEALTRLHRRMGEGGVALTNIGRMLPKGHLAPVPILVGVTFGAPVPRVPDEAKEAFLTRARDALLRLHEGAA